jgi:hypothetical protein
VIGAALGESFFNFLGFKDEREEELIFDDMLIEGDVVFMEVRREEAEVFEVVAGNGEPS